VIEKGLELDLCVAEHVRVWRAPGGVLAQELREHAVLVLGGEVHCFEVDADHFRRAGGIDQVLARRAVLVVVIVLPVLHEEANDVIARALEEERRYR
jgi:hypothetical protein